MATLGNIKIGFGIESICKIQCAATECKNNLSGYNNRAEPMFFGCCNLKRVRINKSGYCREFEPGEKEKT